MVALPVDFRSAWRGLQRDRLYTGSLAGPLALGIGGCLGVIFALAAVLFRPVGVPNADRLVLLEPSGNTYLSAAEFRLLQQTHVGFDRVAAYHGLSVLTERPSSQQARVLAVSNDYFGGVGVGFHAGVPWTESDDREGRRVAVVSHEYWTRWFTGAAVGVASVRINGEELAVLGVLDPAFRGTDVGGPPDILMPIGTYRAVFRDDTAENSEYRWLSVLARLMAGVTPRQAEAAINLALREGDRYREDYIRLQSLRWSSARRIRDFTEALRLMAVISVLVLVVVLANAGALVLVRLHGRQVEVGTRRALGSGGLQAVHSILWECLIVSAVGTVMGSLLARWLSRLIFILYAGRLGLGNDEPLLYSRGVLLSAGVGAIVAIWFFSVVIVRSRSYGDIRELIQGLTQPARTFGWHVFVGMQVLLATCALVVGALLVRTVVDLARADLGFSPSKVIFATVRLKPSVRDEVAASAYLTLLDGLKNLPGAEAATVMANIPIGEGAMSTTVFGPRGTAVGFVRPTQAGANYVGPEFVKTLGMHLLAGREFDARDDSKGQRVAIINETMARFWWRDQWPIGTRLAISKREIDDVEVIGVVSDSKNVTVREGQAPYLYLSLLQHPLREVTALVRTAGDPMLAAPLLPGAVSHAGEYFSLGRLGSLEQHLAAWFRPGEIVATVVGLLGTIGLLVALYGLYGVTAYVVAVRRRELGIRAALGATPRELVWLAVRPVMQVAGAGIVAGIALSVLMLRLVRHLLVGVGGSELLTYAGAALAVLTASTGASYLAARRLRRFAVLDLIRE